MILNWQENLPANETPPRGLWLSEDALVDWFDQVEAARESGSAVADPTSSWEEVEMDENEDAREYRKQMGLT